MYQVLRHEAEAEWVDISEQTLVRELRREGRGNPYIDAERQPARLSFEERSAQIDEARAKAALAQMEPKLPPVAYQARRLLGEVEEPKHRRPEGEG